MYTKRVKDDKQFHFEYRGQDQVTYGCYGFFDPTNKFHITYYIADYMGYRVINHQRQAKIYPQVPKTLEMLPGVTKTWAEIPFPFECHGVGGVHRAPVTTNVPQKTPRDEVELIETSTRFAKDLRPEPSRPTGTHSQSLRPEPSQTGTHSQSLRPEPSHPIGETGTHSQSLRPEPSHPISQTGTPVHNLGPEPSHPISQTGSPAPVVPSQDLRPEPSRPSVHVVPPPTYYNPLEMPEVCRQWIINTPCSCA